MNWNSNIPLCANCHVAPCWQGYKYCSKRCGKEAECTRQSVPDANLQAATVHGGTADGNPIDVDDDLCKECHVRSKKKQRDLFTGNIIVHAFCGRSCKDDNTRRLAETAQQMQQQRTMNGNGSGPKEEVITTSGESPKESGPYSVTYPCCKATLTTVLSPPPAFCPMYMLNTLQECMSQVAGFTGSTTGSIPVPARSPLVQEQNVPTAIPAVVKPSASKIAAEHLENAINPSSTNRKGDSPPRGSSIRRVLPTRGLQTLGVQGTPMSTDHDAETHHRYGELSDESRVNSAFATGISRSYLVRRSTVVEEFSVMDEPKDYGLLGAGNPNHIPINEGFEENSQNENYGNKDPHTMM